VTEASGNGLRSRGAALALLVLVCATAFIGRSVSTSDGAEVISEGLGVMISGEAAYGRMPPGEAATAGVSSGRSMYGIFPTLLALPVLAPAWLLRARLGAPGLDAATALLWTAGVALCGWAFGRLVHVLEPLASPLWAPAFVAGTFLWPYAADSFMEPFAAAALAAGAAVLIRDGAPAGVKAAALWSSACLLKPVLWLTVPLFVLAGVLGSRRHPAPVLKIIGCFGGAVALQLAANALRGSLWDVGYGSLALRFSTSLSTGLFGLLASPGKGLVFYAPLVLLAAFGWRRMNPSERLLLFAVPAAHVLVVARWSWWEGGVAWGPRLLLPVLPLIGASAVHAPRRAAAVALVTGAAVNVLGVLHAPGSWIGYAERLRSPAGVSWPTAGPVRVATIPTLSPLYGHAWLAARDLAGLELPKVWLTAGVAEGEPPPPAALSVSPWLLRRVMGLPPLSPMIPRLLVRSASGYLARREPSKALPWAREATRLSPADADATRLLAYAEEEAGRTRSR
jgi:hypothetical protein